MSLIVVIEMVKRLTIGMLSVAAVSCQQVQVLDKSNVGQVSSEPTAEGQVKPFVEVRKSRDRGYVNFAWLKAYYTFSFGSYEDPDYDSFRSLWVLNEDTIKPGAGFDTHSHDNMEILVYVVSGALKHTDSMGHEHIMRTGDFHLMSAGSGVEHAEHNAANEDTHILVAWVKPDKRNLRPDYQEWVRPKNEKLKRVLVASPEGKRGAMKINQKVRISKISLTKGQTDLIKVEKGGAYWLQVIKGAAELQGRSIRAGDGARSESAGLHQMRSKNDFEALLIEFDE